LRAALTIAGKDLRQRLRDRSLFLIGLLAPLSLALIFSFLLAPITGSTFRPDIGIADLDRSELSERFREVLNGLDDSEIINLYEGLDEAEARRMAEAGEIAASYVIPQGFGLAVMNGQDTEITILGNVDSPTSTAIAKAIATGFADRVRLSQLAVGGVAMLTGGVPDPSIGELVVIEIGDVTAAARELDPGTYYTAAMAVFFLFFTVQVGVTSLLDETRDGTMARLQAAPISRISIVAAKGLTSFALGVTSMLVLALASIYLIGAEWNNPLGGLVLILAVVASAVGIVGLIAGFANSPDSAGSIQSIVAVTLGAMGGSFFQVSLGEGALSKIAMLTPHHWFLSGLADLAGGEGVGGVLDSAAAMLAFAFVTGGIGWVFLRRKVSA